MKTINLINYLIRFEFSLEIQGEDFIKENKSIICNELKEELKKAFNVEFEEMEYVAEETIKTILLIDKIEEITDSLLYTNKEILKKRKRRIKEIQENYFLKLFTLKDIEEMIENNEQTQNEILYFI